MAVNEIDNVCRFLSTKQITISTRNEWLIACIEWFLSENSEYSVQEIQEFSFNQLLLADLNVVAQECLPSVVTDAHTIKLQGIYFLQVNCFFDVGQSAYKQYQKISKRDLLEDNDDEDGEMKTDEKTYWEKQGNRMLKMEMTDGVRTVYGMEYSSIPKLNPGTMIPGVKVLLKGPVECRSGVIMMHDNNIEILGGEVDSLYEVNHINRIITRKLNLDENLLPINNDVPEIRNPTPAEQNYSVPSIPLLSNNVSVANELTPRIHNQDVVPVQQGYSIDDFFEDSDIFLNVPVDHLMENDNASCEPTGVVEIENDNTSCEPTGNKVVEVNASVTAFKSNLLMKNDNWSLTVKLNTNEGSMKATFDPDLLDRIIGFSPVELSARESEIAVNPAIREKLDSMLKKSQQVIRNLNCSMTLAQNEGDELPSIIAVGDESVFNNSL